MLKMNHSSMGLNWPFITVVYKKAVICGTSRWNFLKIIKGKRKGLFDLVNI
jgi:hypothetical protein